MASRKMLVHLDMSGNQLQNTGFEQLAAAPVSPILAQQYWDTATSKALIWNGTAWVELGSTTTMTTGTTALTFTATAGGYEGNVAVADTSNAGLISSTFFDLLDNATSTNAFNTLVLRDGAGVFTTNTVAGLQAPTAGGQATNKTYVDDAVATALSTANTYTDTSTTSGMKIKGNIDCSTNPNYPVAVIGDAYFVTVDGKIGGASGEVVKTNDLIICTVDNAGGTEAAVGTSWIVQERNLDLATTTVAGYIRLATTAEVTTGTATDAIPTVADVTSMVNASSVGTFIQKLTAGSTSYTVSHNLNGAVIAQIYNKVTGAYASATITKTDSNTLTITTNSNLAQDHIVCCTFIGTEPA